MENEMQKTTSIWARLAAMAGPLLIAGCEPIETDTTAANTAPAAPVAAIQDDIEASRGPAVASAAAFIADTFNSAAGQNLGGDVVITQAVSEGPLVTVTFRIFTTNRRYEQSTARRQMRNFACNDEIIRSFIDIGGEFRSEFRSRTQPGILGQVTLTRC